MDGTFAAVFAIVSLTDMALNECPTGCLKEGVATQRLSFQTGAVVFDDDVTGSELYLGYDHTRRIGNLQLTSGVSVTDEGSLWIGSGAKWTSTHLVSGPWFAEASFMPGLHFAGDGPDLGGVLHFRSALGIGYEFDNGNTVTLAVDHRSNGDLLDLNPGLETISLRYAMTWN